MLYRFAICLSLFISYVLVAPTSVHAGSYTFPAVGSQAENLSIYSSTDAERIEPLIKAFQKRNTATAVTYHELSTIDVFEQTKAEIDAHLPTADLTLSSAMDLQIKLVNDGYSQPHVSDEIETLPKWANWRNEAVGFTYEPAVMVYNRRLAPDLSRITTRFELANAINKKGFRLRGRVVTYDPAKSGLGYLFGTQDAIQSEDFWYLARSLGDSGVQQMSGSGDMIDKVASGEALIAYNVLGSYALARARKNPALAITLLQDYSLVMSRIAVITKNAPNAEAAGRFIDFLLSREGQSLIAGPASLYALRTDIKGAATAKTLQEKNNGPLIPIRLGPGLLVYLDHMKRKDFLERWQKTTHKK